MSRRMLQKLGNSGMINWFLKAFEISGKSTSTALLKKSVTQVTQNLEFCWVAKRKTDWIPGKLLFVEREGFYAGEGCVLQCSVTSLILQSCSLSIYYLLNIPAMICKKNKNQIRKSILKNSVPKSLFPMYEARHNFHHQNGLLSCVLQPVMTKTVIYASKLYMCLLSNQEDTR